MNNINTKKCLKFHTRAVKTLSLRALTSAFVIACLTPLPGFANTDVNVIFPNGEYTEATVDMRVSAVGGDIILKRTWENNRWYINPVWTHLRFITDPLDGSVQMVDRGGIRYQRSGNTNIYIFDQVFIQKTYDTWQGGWRWYDRQGNWITYDHKGRATAYGNANDVGAKFVFDFEGRRTEVRDHFNQLVYKFEYDTEERLVKTTDRIGRSVRYHWEGERLVKVTDVMGNDWTYKYDKSGQLIERVEPDGSVKIDYEYSPPAPVTAIISGKEYTLPTITHIDGGNLSDYYTARVSKLTDKNGAVTLWNSHYSKLLKTYTVTEDDPLGKKTVTVYNNEGKLLTRHVNGKLTEKAERDGKFVTYRTDDRGLMTITHYDHVRHPVKTVYPDGAFTTMEYNYTLDKPIRFTDRQGIVTEWQYDKKGNLLTQIDAVGKPEQQVTSFSYDNHGQPISATYGKGKQLPRINAAGESEQHNTTAYGKEETEGAVTVRFDYDTFGNITSYTDGEGHVHHYSRTFDGSISEYQTPSGKKWQYGHNNAGHLTSITNPLSQTTRYEVDSLGRRTAITNPLGQTTHWSYSYNNEGMVINRTNNQGQTNSYQYDLNGKSIQNNTANNLTYKFSYDADGRLQQFSDAAGNAIILQYDASGKLPVATQYPTFNETYQYNRMGQVTEVKQHLDEQTASVTKTSYNAIGLPVSITEPGDLTYFYEYDSFGHVIKETDPLGNSIHQSWDSLNRISTVTDANGNIIQYFYNKNSALIREVMPSGQSISYNYDEDGRLSGVQDAQGNITTYQYDDADRLINEIVTADGKTEPQQMVSYSYNDANDITEIVQTGITSTRFVYTIDELGRTIQEDITYGSGDNAFTKTLKYRYDEDNNLVAITYPDNNEVIFSRENGLLAQAMLPNGKTIGWGNYRWNRPTEIHFPGTIQSIDYDALLRPLEIKVTAGNATLMQRDYHYNEANNISQRKTEDGDFNYSYDRLNQLTQVTPPQLLQQKGLPVESYAYDAVGNRIGSSHQPGEWRYSVDNQLTLMGDNLNRTNFDYTQNGNIATEVKMGQIRHYIYDATDRLTNVITENAETARYQYDPFGRRISKTVNDQTIWYLYTSEGLIAELNEQGQMTVAYGWLPDSDWGTQPLWQANLGINQTLHIAQYHYLHLDHLGTPQLATDEQGNVIWKGIYEAFGKVLLDNANRITMNLRFPGQYYDDETELHYNHFRNYNIETGRYIQRDPLELFDGVNVYSYVGSNPLSVTDPFGLARCVYIISTQKFSCTSSKSSKMECSNSADPDGNYSCEYTPTTETTSIDEEYVHSGVGDHENNVNSVNVREKGPIPPGVYRMSPNEKSIRTGSNWWAIQDINWIPGVSSELFDKGKIRAGFNLHIGTTSLGCITVSSKAQDQYDALTDMLKRDYDAGKGNILEVKP